MRKKYKTGTLAVHADPFVDVAAEAASAVPVALVEVPFIEPGLAIIILSRPSFSALGSYGTTISVMDSLSKMGPHIRQ